MIEPFFKWVGSWVIVLSPAFVYLLVAWQRGDITGPQVLDMIGGGLNGLWQGAASAVGVFVVLLCLGIALWPIVVLCIALGGFDVLYRADLIVLTIVRTFPAYVLTLALMFAAVLLSAVLETGSKGALAGQGRAGGWALAHVLTVGLGIYFDIVLMRLIGLYYHHFKHRFAFDWG
jgi:hypothetical protein